MTFVCISNWENLIPIEQTYRFVIEPNSIAIRLLMHSLRILRAYYEGYCLCIRFGSCFNSTYQSILTVFFLSMAKLSIAPQSMRVEQKQRKFPTKYFACDGKLHQKNISHTKITGQQQMVQSNYLQKELRIFEIFLCTKNMTNKTNARKLGI